MAMALQLAIQSLAASLFRSPNKPATKPPSNGHRHPQEPTGSSRCSGRRSLAAAAAWRELQTALRASAANLNQDLYAIIQARPPGQRPELRRLYSDLFNNVTRVGDRTQINLPFEPLTLLMAC